MRGRNRGWLWAAALALALVPGVAASADLHGRASTVFQWWERADDGRDVLPLAEYLTFGTVGLVKGQDVSVQGYGRLSKDLGSSDPWRGRVFYLFADWKGALGNRLDLRAGRQFSHNAAGTAVVDGVDVKVRGGPVEVRAFGGGNVQYVEGYQWGDAVAALSVSLSGFEHTDLEVAAFTKWDHEKTAREILGALGSQDLGKWGRAYGEVQYDYLSDEFNEYLAGLRILPGAGWTLTGEYFRSIPVFDATSLYSVFAVEEYREARVKASWEPTFKARLYAGGQKIWYGEGGQAWEALVGTRLVDGLGTRLEVEVSRRFGEGGDLTGAHAALFQEFRPTRLTAEIGADYQRFEKNGMITRGDTSGYWGELAYRWTKTVATTARVENIVDAGGKNHVEGLLRADLDF